MANYFVDSTTGDNGDSGLTMALAWDTLEYGVESGGLSAADIIWVRRIHVEYSGNPTSGIQPAYSGTRGQPIKVIGWPRPAIPDTTITQADWTNGSNLVDNVVGITPKREQHMGRYCTAPNGKKYLITAILYEFTVDGMGAGDEFTVGSKITNTTGTLYGKIWAFTDNLDTTGVLQCVLDKGLDWDTDDNVTDADGGDAELSGDAVAVGFLIDREYSGSTVTGTDGKFQIEADEDYATAQALGDPDIATWNADAIDLPCIDFKDQVYNLYFPATIHDWHIRNLEIRDSADGYGNVWSRGPRIVSQGCLLYNKNNASYAYTFYTYSGLLKRSILEGPGTGSNNRGLMVGSWAYLEDVAIYNFGDYGINMSTSVLSIENVNIGIEAKNGDDGIEFGGTACFVIGRDLQVDAPTDIFSIPTNASGRNQVVSIENFQKVLGNHYCYSVGQAITSVPVDGGSDPEKRSGGADVVIEVDCSLNSSDSPSVAEMALNVFGCPHEFELAVGTYVIRYYVQCKTMSTTATELYLEAEYVDSYDDATEYTITKVQSDEACAERSGADDWAKYIEVTVSPVVASKVRVSCYINKYDADGKLYIDPNAVIS